MTKQKLAQTRAGHTRGRGSRSRPHGIGRRARERWEEARGGRRPQPTMEDPSPDDAGQKTGESWSRRAGRDEGRSKTFCGDQQEDVQRLGAAGARGTMWKTASAIVPQIGRTTPASRRRPHPQRTLHKDRTGGDLFLFTHLLVEVSVLFLYLPASSDDARCFWAITAIPRTRFLFTHLLVELALFFLALFLMLFLFKNLSLSLSLSYTFR